MSRPTYRILLLVMVCLLALSACRPAVSLPSPTSLPTPVLPLTVTLLYPGPDSVIEMGNPLKTIVQVTGADGAPVNHARVGLVLSDPDGTRVGEIEALPGEGEVYRSQAWPIPHREQAGTWRLLVQASLGEDVWETDSSFQVVNSISEDLLAKYGFWVDAPTLGGIQPALAAERGDAENGLIRWGGVAPAMHIFPENWIEIHWRKGRRNLDSSEAVRRFLLEDLGDLGVTPLREIGEFAPARFKDWDAWQGTARGELSRYDMQWVVFYAPEVDETYAIATMVVLAPPGIDAHAALRDGFGVDPEVHAQGVAPEPLLGLAPAPKLLDPPLGARFEGLDQPIVLQWEPVKALAEDEYYEVIVDYNYREANYKERFYTRESQITLPEQLYYEPNCLAFNWRVTLKRQTGETGDGRPAGEALTYPSLYGYILWAYPPGEDPDFPPACLNEQY